MLELIRGGLVVSCQAPISSPLRRPDILAAMAQSCMHGGAKAIRADGPDSISAIKHATALPIIGIYKIPRVSARPWITPSLELARQLVKAGADAVALEFTAEAEANYGLNATHLLSSIQSELGVPVIADISTFEEGLRAWQAGADAVATTLSGYTPYSRQRSAPDIELVRHLAAAGIRVIAEGRIRKPEQAAEALRAGAWAVVVGDAITNPLAITSWFVRALRREVDLDDDGAGDRWGAD